MKLLTVIPARAGSKRIPNKNIRELGGKPLITWTIDAAKRVPELNDVIVSTDSPAIAHVASQAGALVPWLRPAALATDTSTSIEVCMHALDWYERERGQVDGLLLLQPTSPFRSVENIREAINLFRKHPKQSVVSFSPAESHPMWCYEVEGETITPFIESQVEATRSQDLPPAYVVNGAIYVAGPTYLRKNNSFLGKYTVPLVMTDFSQSLDIDTEWDWKLAEIVA